VNEGHAKDVTVIRDCLVEIADRHSDVVDRREQACENV
jgi:hypothetical protein